MGTFQINTQLDAQKRADTGEMKDVITKATTLTPADQVVFAKAPATSSYTITLPPVAECRGMKFYIECVGTSGTGTIDVDCQKDGVVSLATLGNSKLNAAKECACYENWGGRLWVLAKVEETH